MLLKYAGMRQSFSEASLLYCIALVQILSYNNIVDWDVDQFDEITNESHDKETNGQKQVELCQFLCCLTRGESDFLEFLVVGLG